MSKAHGVIDQLADLQFHGEVWRVNAQHGECFALSRLFTPSRLNSLSSGHHGSPVKLVPPTLKDPFSCQERPSRRWTEKRQGGRMDGKSHVVFLGMSRQLPVALAMAACSLALSS